MTGRNHDVTVVIDPSGAEDAPLNENAGKLKSTLSSIFQTRNGSTAGGVTPVTQYSLSRAEAVHGLANRILYSRFYTWLYLGMALLSTISIILSIKEKCPSVWFIILEFIINFAMIAEVMTRFLALRQLFWKSIYNVVDITLVFLCVLTLIFIWAGGCSKGRRSEEIFDTILLVVRNLIQFGRLIIMLKKNRKNRSTRNARIDFSDIRAPSMSMDIDSLSHGAFSLTDDEDDDLF
ncbi:hypothetical protein G9A89_013527 [Geosiphon pyriformis]|nr:hypothetical protein G9A89_013527 [Geosiphon pyriformis]